MKYLLITLLTLTTALADSSGRITMPPLPGGIPLNPPAPVLQSLQRSSSPINPHITLCWQCGLTNIEAFQIMRRAVNQPTKAVVVNHLKMVRKYVAATGVRLFEWVDKDVDLTTEYTYSVLVFTDSPQGTSLESNTLTITP